MKKKKKKTKSVAFSNLEDLVFGVVSLKDRRNESRKNKKDSIWKRLGMDAVYYPLFAIALVAVLVTTGVMWLCKGKRKN